MVKTPQNEILKSTLQKDKTPIRIFAELVHYPPNTLILIAVCIAEQIIKFSSHQNILKNMLHKFTAYPTNKTKLDLLRCKRRLTFLDKHDFLINQELNPKYWQQKTDNHVIRSMKNLYYIVIEDKGYRIHFNRFMQNAAMAYGFYESKRQIINAQKQLYDFGDEFSQIIETQKHNKLRAHCSWRSGERVAYHEFIKRLRERFCND